MNEVISIQNYEQLRSRLNEELNQAANSFVRIGYLLKMARDDKNILEGSGYSDVNEFAKTEFGLDKTQVSRFIRINDRFSLNGNTPELLPEYSEFGSAKLSLMLTLPDEINEEISPEMSKSDIQALKDDYDEESKITPIELALEEKPQDEPDEFIALVVKRLHDEHPEPAELMKEAIDAGGAIGIPSDWDYENDAIENYMPDGDKIYNIRIEGQGRFMISCKESGISIINMRDPANKTPLTWKEFAKAAVEDVSRRDFKKPEAPKAEPKSKPKKVEKSKPKKAPVAPVQPEIEKAEGEVVEKGEMDPPEEGQQENETEEEQRQQEDQDDEDNEDDSGQQEEKELEKDVIEQLEKIIQEIEDPEKTNWDHIKEQLFGAIHEINHRA